MTTRRMKYTLWVLRVLLGALFLVAGSNHFLSPAFYLDIMPRWLPAHGFLVFLSGLTEMAAGVLLLIPRFTRWGAWLIVAHLVAFMPVHVDMLVHAERYPQLPREALWARIFIQLLLIGWALLFTRRRATAGE